METYVKDLKAHNSEMLSSLTLLQESFSHLGSTFESFKGMVVAQQLTLSSDGNRLMKEMEIMVEESLRQVKKAL